MCIAEEHEVCRGNVRREDSPPQALRAQVQSSHSAVIQSPLKPEAIIPEIREEGELLNY